MQDPMHGLECAGHLEKTPGPDGRPRFSVRGVALRPGQRIEILFGLDEWNTGEFGVSERGVPCIRIGEDVVRIFRVAFLRLPHEDCH